MLETITNIGKTIDLYAGPSKVAIIDLSHSEPKSITYQELDNMADAVARGLTNQGIKIGDKVAMLGDNSIGYVATFFGIMRLGAIPVLINNKLTPSQVSFIVTESESKLVLTNFNDYLDYGAFETYQPQEEDPAFLLYTSGSYGDPKGAVITHKRHAWSILRYTTNDKAWSSKRITLISAPLYHANGLTTLEGSIAGHSTIVLLPKFDAQVCLQSIEKYKINTIYGIPTMLAMMMQESNIGEFNLTSVRQIRLASSPMSQKLIDNINRYFPNTIITNNYGITEVGPGLFGAHPDNLPRPPASVGYPYPGIEYRLVNGILEIKSPSMMTSYYKRENPSITEDGFFITNDLFTVDQNGFYYFLGRADDMFKCGGNSVFPNQVEQILESYKGVNSAFVLGLPDDLKGYKPYAFVILEHGCTVSEKELKEYTLSKGPAYQHPRRIWFVDSFPLAGTNKINKKELERIATELLSTH